MKQYILGAAFFFLFLCLAPRLAAVRAKELSGVTVIPSQASVTLSNGQDSVISIFYTNNTKQEVDLNLSTIDFGSLNESGGIAFLGSRNTSFEKQYGLSDWMTLEKDFVVLPPGKSDHVKLTIHNQQSLSPGGHYGAVLAKMEFPQSAADKGILLRSTLSSLLFVKKTGGGIYQLVLKNTHAERTWYGAVQAVSLRFQNSGNIHLIPRGYVDLTDPTGMLVARGIINSGSGIMLPESFRIFETALSPVSFAYRIGTYRLLVHYRFDGESVYKKLSLPLFILPPAWLVILGIVLIVFSGFVVYRRIRNRSKRS